MAEDGGDNKGLQMTNRKKNSIKLLGCAHLCILLCFGFRGPFLESPSNLMGSKPYLKIKI